MQRELKFRVWHKEFKRFLSKEEYFLDFDGQLYFFDYHLRELILLNKRSYFIQQFTNLFDKKRNEIYDGDIVKIYYKDPVVGTIEFSNTQGGSEAEEWVVEYAQWVLKKYNADNAECWPNYHLSHEDYREVIGNIFENPELLNKINE